MSEQHSPYSLVNAIPADDDPYLTQANDFITKSVNGPFIDTGRRVEFMEGKTRTKVYLSVETIREMATVAGLFDLLPSEEENNQASYNQGYQDALKEGLADDIRAVHDRLGFVADRLTDFLPVDTGVSQIAVETRIVPSAVPSGDAFPDKEEPASFGLIEDLSLGGIEDDEVGDDDPDGEVVDTSESKRASEGDASKPARRQGSRARFNDRPASVSSGSGDEPAILGI